MDMDKKIAEIEEWLASTGAIHSTVTARKYFRWLINQLKAHRKVLEDKEDHLLEVYDQLKACRASSDIIAEQKDEANRQLKACKEEITKLQQEVRESRGIYGDQS